ncbi:MAG: hypothetical protein ABIN89_13345 [Chitinophagaceae bacterium]
MPWRNRVRRRSGRSQLVIKPANFHDEKVAKQTDGALFWKITNVRGNMIPFKEGLKAEESKDILFTNCKKDGVVVIGI